MGLITYLAGAKPGQVIYCTRDGWIRKEKKASHPYETTIRIRAYVNHGNHSPTGGQQIRAQPSTDATPFAQCAWKPSCIHCPISSRDNHCCEHNDTKQIHVTNSAAKSRRASYSSCDMKGLARPNFASGRHQQQVHIDGNDHQHRRTFCEDKPPSDLYCHHAKPDHHHQQQRCHCKYEEPSLGDQQSNQRSQQHLHNSHCRDRIDADARYSYVPKRASKTTTVPDSPKRIIDRIFCDTDAAIAVHFRNPSKAAMKHHMIMVRRFGMFCEICRSRDMEELGYIPQATHNLVVQSGKESAWCSLCGALHADIDEIVLIAMDEEHAKEDKRRYCSATCEEDTMDGY